MKSFLIRIFAVMAISCIVKVSGAQTTTSNSATVNLITPLTLTELEALDFGDISVNIESGSADGTCILGVDGVRTPSSGVTCLATDEGTNATYNLSGAANNAYLITYPATIPVYLDGDSGSSSSLTISDLVIKTANNGTGTSYNLDSNGSDQITLGATLTLPAGSITAGTYSNTFEITVAYN